MRVSETLSAMAREVSQMEAELLDCDRQDHDTVYRYYYGKGALDYRDKLLKAAEQCKSDQVTWTVVELLKTIFPDPYPGPAK